MGTCEACVGKRFGVPAVLNRCYRNSFTQSLAGSMAFAWYQLQDYAKNIDAYFALSQFQYQKVKPLLNGSTLFIKPNPIDEPGVFLDPAKRKDFLFVGRLEAAKGIELLLNTWLQLPNTFHLNVIGASDDPALIQKYTRPNISFLGKRPHEEVLQHMARAKYLLHTSLTYETFGLTMVEALARGTPVIGLNIGTRPEFITHGKNGFLCTPSELKQTLITANDYTHYDTLSANAIQSVKPFYAQTVIAKQVALYQQMLTSDRAR
jgi:glycosyltransferase involved in cell wall biosynthesis